MPRGMPTVESETAALVAAARALYAAEGEERTLRAEADSHVAKLTRRGSAQEPDPTPVVGSIYEINQRLAAAARRREQAEALVRSALGWLVIAHDI